MAELKAFNDLDGNGIPADKQREFLESLECPVCKEISPPPIYNCANGHMICGNCHGRLDKCPLCAGEFTTTRNLPIEYITSLLQLKCTNEGCGRTFKGDVFKTHVTDECVFRPVACFCQTGSKCAGKQIDAIKYEQHIKEVHRSNGYECLQTVYEFMHTAHSLETSSNGHHRIQYMKIDGRLFMLNDRIEKKSFFSWITVADSEEVAKNYEVSLTYYENKSPKARCAWKVGVHSYRKTLENIQMTGELVGLPTSVLIPLSEHYEYKHETRKRKLQGYEWRVTARVYLKDTV